MPVKRLCALALCLVFMLCAACAFAQTLYVRNPDPQDRLNLRAAPRQSALTLGKYYSGTAVQVLGRSGDYLYVRAGTMEGYMMSAYLSETFEDARPVMEVANAAGTGANLRAQPDAAAEITYFARNGETLAVLGVRDDGWLHVQSEGNTGFVRASLLAGSVSFHQPGYEGDAPSAINGSPLAYAPKANATRAIGNPYDQAESASVRAMTSDLAIVHNPDPADRLNLRSKPRSGAEIIAKYYSGAVVHILGAGADGYLHVSISDGLDGYMLADYLVMDGSAVACATPARIITASGGLTLYDAPSAGSGALVHFPRGTQVTVLGVTQDWCHITVDGYTGFMRTYGLDDQTGLTY